ncbi:MAG: ANTAR domain-containing protein [Oscillospiraceae bacterium]|jgi:response regulator NasT|nr:ANTAR domain-containing protein [Oscillospiraceae bacterium]
MPRYLLVSATEKAGQPFRDILAELPDVAVFLCAAPDTALQTAAIQGFDCCIVSAPPRGQPDGAFALTLADATQAQILFLAPRELHNAHAERLRQEGILTLEKPVGRQTLLHTLELMQTVQRRVHLLQTQNRKLEQKLDELKLIHRAKCVLISSLGMSEAQAHKHLERQAMNQRISKYEAALNVLKLYEDRY